MPRPLIALQRRAAGTAAVLTWAALLFCPARLSAGAEFEWRNFFPAALEAEDWDARDAQNRPVASSRAKRSLRRLFVSSLFAAAEDPALAQRARIRQFLDHLLNPLKTCFSRTLPSFLRTLKLFTFFIPKREFRQETVGSWRLILFWACLSTGCLRFAAHSISAVPSSVPLPLRC